MKPIVESKRDQRILDWLVARVGETVVADACMQLEGARKPYVSNIARFLNLVPSEDLAATPPEDARRKLAEIQQILGKRSAKE